MRLAFGGVAGSEPAAPPGVRLAPTKRRTPNRGRKKQNMKRYPTRPYESAAEVRVGDIVRMRHEGELHGGISPAFDDSMIIAIVARPTPHVRLARPHMRLVDGRWSVEVERFFVEVELFMRRFDVLTTGPAGGIDNRAFEAGGPATFGTGGRTVSLVPASKVRPGLLATLQSVGFAIVTEGTSDPRDVLARLLGALAELEPKAALAITGGGLFPPTIPDEALADELHEFWSSDEATETLGSLMRELNQAAPAGFCFAPEGDWTRLGFFREAP